VKRIILGIILATAASVSLATGNSNGCQGNCPQSGGNTTVNTDVRNTNTNVNTNANTNVNTNITTQGQQQGQLQGQLQGQGQVQGQVAKGGNATNAGNSQSTAITFNEQKQAVAAFAPAMNSTAPCRVAVGVGIGASIGGVSVGSAYKDEECNAREKGRMLIESARIAHSMGAPTEVYADLFMEGLALIRGSAEERKASVAPASKLDVSYVQ
jgi:hypothetical protein